MALIWLALIWHKFLYAKVISQITMQPVLTYFIAEAKKLIANLLLLPDDHTRLDIPTI
jgi:hypothetical protein